MIRWLLAVLVFSATPAVAVTCENLRYRGDSYTVCTVDVAQSDLRLFHKDPGGAILGQFGAIGGLPDVGRVIFAMNAGMYHENREPVGHYKEAGITYRDPVANAGPGNFGMLPNGVFCLNAGAAQIFETRRYLRDQPSCRDATQSGPMLVIDGALHPRFLPDSTSRFVRNGVGVSADGAVAVFAISNNAVSFHAFASLFRDYLRVPNALYFDGKVSRMFMPEIGRNDFGFRLGPMVAVVAQP